MNGIEKYNLTEEEFENCLKMAEIALLLRVRPSNNPKSIFIVSQAGGGKTGLKTFIEKEKNSDKLKDIYIEINPDEVAIYHKYYEEIMREYPRQSHNQIQKFVRPALDEYLRQRAVQFRASIIQEGTFGSTEGYIKILDFQKNGGKAAIGKLKDNGTREEIMVDGGYNIEIDILAVDRYESLLSSYEREQYFIESGLPPRSVTAENHDRAYENLIKTVKEIERRKLYDKIRVFKRGKIEIEPELIYESGGEQYENVTSCIVQARDEERKKIIKNKEQYLNRINELKQRVTNENLISKIVLLEKEFRKELQEERYI